MPDPKSEFKNTTGGYIGAQVKNHNGQMRGIAVRANHTIWLDEDEQIATANSPRRDEDNPFEGDPPPLELVTAAKDIANRRPIGHTEKTQVNDVPPEEAAGAPEPPAAGATEDKPSDAEEAAPAAPEEPPAPPAEKTEAEMTEEEKREANAKAAAARAVPPGGSSKPSVSQKAPPSGAGKGQAAPGEKVGTPAAQGK